jgi:hypothetical protein
MNVLHEESQTCQSQFVDPPVGTPGCCQIHHVLYCCSARGRSVLGAWYGLRQLRCRLVLLQFRYLQHT